MRNRLFFIILAVVLLSGMLVVPTARAVSDLDGVWLTHGYGMVVEINGDQFTVYDLTPVSCTPLFDESILAYVHLQFTVENGELVVRDDMTYSVTAERLDSLPEVCANGGTQTENPEVNFEAFWHDFNEQYAFFELYNVDWQAQYDQYRPQVTSATTPDELFTILCEMIRPLEDGHVMLSTGADVCSSGKIPAWIDNPDDPFPTMQLIQDVIINGYLKADISFDSEADQFQGDEAHVANGKIIYGKLSDTVGYIDIHAMYFDGDDDLAMAGAAMDRIMADFAGLETVIVDIRLNSGGEDGIAFALASRFADERRLVSAKQARDGNGFTPAREFYIEPGGPQQFTGKVILLTSQFTASAAETFTLAMTVLPHVTVVGETTNGIYSDNLERVLPNGWLFLLSNEVFTAADGQIYEGIGYPPDVAIALDLEGFRAGKDPMLDAALELAAE